MPANATSFLVPDLPGMGDNLFTMHFGLIGKDIWNEMQTVTTLEQAKKIIKSYYRISNGMPFCIFTMSLTTYDDITGWQELCQYANEHNGHMGFYTSLNYASSYPYNSCGRFFRNASDESKADADFIPEFAKSLNPSGEWKLCWDQGVYNRLYGVSVANLWKHKNHQNDKNLLITIAEEYVKHWGINSIMAIHWDYYCNPQTNENSQNGGALTTPEEEWVAFNEIFAYLWQQYGISHCIETEPAIPSKYACMYHSRRADTFIPDRITNRNRRFGATEYGWGEDRLEFIGYAPVAKTGYVKPFSKVRENFYKYMLVYAFHQKTQDFDSQVQEGITLHRNVDLQNSAVIGDRFVPQVGCGCRVITYSEKGSYEQWTLPKSWHGLQWADIYLLDTEFDPKLITERLTISETIHLNIPPDTAYVIVPHNYHPTPIRLSFDDLNGCTMIENYGGIFWGKIGEAKFQIQARGPGGTAGGMGTVTIYLSDTQNEVDTNIRFLDKAILHSFRIGNKGGEGMITMISSTEGNTAFNFSLPATGRTAFIETNWQLPENHSIRLVLQCSTGVHNILFDDFVYGLIKT